MSKKIWISLLATLVLTLIATAVYAGQPFRAVVPAGKGAAGQALAQGPRGSIRGTIFEDKNADGKCVDTGDPVLAGIPIKFVSNDGDAVVYLQSGANGTYGLVAAGLGTWTVSAEPSAGYVVTSKNPLQVFLGPEQEQRLVLGADFCVAKGTATTTTDGGTTGVIFLPVAGAAVAPNLIWAASIGTCLIIVGLGLEWRRRRTSRVN